MTGGLLKNFSRKIKANAVRRFDDFTIIAANIVVIFIVFRSCCCHCRCLCIVAVVVVTVVTITVVAIVFVVDVIVYIVIYFVVVVFLLAVHDTIHHLQQ